MVEFMETKEKRGRFPNNLGLWLKAYGLKPQDLADAVGRDVNLIHKIVAGDRLGGHETRRLIAQFLEMDEEDWIYGVPGPLAKPELPLAIVGRVLKSDVARLKRRLSLRWLKLLTRASSPEELEDLDKLLDVAKAPRAEEPADNN